MPYIIHNIGACDESGDGCADCPPSICYCGLTEPVRGLTVFWSNQQIGDDSTSISRVAPCKLRSSGCANSLILDLNMAVSPPVLTVTYFTAGSCPGGTRASCTFAATTHSCTPLVFTYNVTKTNCLFLFNRGYVTFTVTE